jgi:hypothetical protein
MKMPINFKIDIDGEILEEFQVVNTGHRNKMYGKDFYLYRVKKPHHLNSYQFWHHKKEGWHYLIDQIWRELIKIYWEGDKNAI